MALGRPACPAGATPVRLGDTQIAARPFVNLARNDAADRAAIAVGHVRHVGEIVLELPPWLLGERYLPGAVADGSAALHELARGRRRWRTPV
jgi:hypothetical protein